MSRTFTESPLDSILQQDIEDIAQHTPLITKLTGTTVFITGATGLIGSQVVKTLACCNRVMGSNIHIAALVRSEDKARSLFGDLADSDELELVIGDIMTPVNYDKPIDYFIHGASATSSKYFVEHPVETIMMAVEGTRNMLELARSKQVKGFLYLSSLEVYGVPSGDKKALSETDSGYINPLLPRSSYSEGKRMVECLCASYHAEYGVPVKIARLSQTFGAGVTYDDGRVFAEFARSAIEKKDIVLHTAGNTVRTYCYTKDAVSALLYILLKGSCGAAYNVTNQGTRCSIKEMAELVCKTFPESGISVRFDIPEDASSFGYNPEMIIELDTTALRGLGWEPSVSLQSMFERMVASLKERYHK